MLRDIVAPPIATSATMNSFTHESLKIVIYWIFKLALYSFEAQVQLSDKNCPAISTCHHDATQKNNEGDEGHDGTESHEDDDESPEIHEDDEGATAKGKSKKARISPQYKCSGAKCQYGFNAKNAKVTFYYGSKPCTKTANELKMIAATLLGPLQMAASASNARRVWAHHCKV